MSVSEDYVLSNTYFTRYLKMLQTVIGMIFSSLDSVTK